MKVITMCLKIAVNFLKRLLICQNYDKHSRIILAPQSDGACL